MVESSGPRSSTPSAGFFRMPGLFVRLSGGKGLSVDGGAVDPDSVWSPTSPLDLRNNLRSSPPRVGLGLVDALTCADAAGSPLFGGKASSFLDSIRPFLEPPSALPKPPPPLAAFQKDAASVIGVAATTTPDGGVADSEEYTCVIARGANPRTTHILGGGETLEVRGGPAGAGYRKKVVVAFTVEPFADRPSEPPSPAGVASGRCGCCMRRLPEDREIFIYKGEKAFCSNECREGYIEEEVEDAREDLMTLEHGSSTAFFLGEDW